jgi:putative methyltransferase (TIGR04325 family)
MGTKAWVRSHTPPTLLRGYRALRSRQTGAAVPGERLCLDGDFASWEEACEASTGYAADIILERTKAALLQVKYGNAVYERDSVLFDEIQYAWPLLAGLMWIAAQDNGRLNVLDFGGSLGSTYFQNRGFLADLPEVRWNIVEQPRHVEVGRGFFEDEQLRFYASVDECTAHTQPNVIILSGVLQFFRDPHKTLTDLSSLGCGHLIVDRTPFWNGPTDRLCVEHVPEYIYPASYPSWIFSTRRFRSHIEESWVVAAEFDALDRLPGPVECTFRGMIASRREPV